MGSVKNGIQFQIFSKLTFALHDEVTLESIGQTLVIAMQYTGFGELTQDTDGWVNIGV